jgi:hypothetical protein
VWNRLHRFLEVVYRFPYLIIKTRAVHDD